MGWGAGKNMSYGAKAFWFEFGPLELFLIFKMEIVKFMPQSGWTAITKCFSRHRVKTR